MSSPSDLQKKIKALAATLGRSELEVVDLLAHNTERILGEADLGDRKVPLDRILTETFEEKRRMLASLGQMNADLAEIKTVISERKNILASLVLNLSRQQGFARPLPEISSDLELHQSFGIIDSEGRTYPSPEPRVYDKNAADAGQPELPIEKAAAPEPKTNEPVTTPLPDPKNKKR